MPELAQTNRGPQEEDKPKSRDDFIVQAVKRFNRALQAESENRSNAVDDLNFKNGDQWPEDIRSKRTIDNRPCLTINKCKTFVHQITNDQRQNRPSINVSPVGDLSDINTAKMLKGLIKQIERQSNADVAYDTGFDSAVSNGWGYWRILTEYGGEDSFDQVIRIGRIRNPFRVYLDPDHQEPDGSDAQWGFISDLIPRGEFKQQWPDKDEVAWSDSGLGDEYKEWSTQTHIRIAEYFYFETKTKKLLALANGHIGFEEELAPELQLQIKNDPTLILKEREVPCKYLKWCKLTAKDILEEQEWPGKWIPIVKCVGDEIDVEGKITLAGLIRDAKDPQRMYNYWCTTETEMNALLPKAPFIMEEGQVEGHEKRWQDANVKNYPYLLYRGVNISGKPAPAPQRQQFSGPPAGVVAAKIAAAQDMQATTGIRFDATLNERMYDESGKALRELKRVGDLGNFHYVDNLARSLRHTGRILIDLIPKIYDTPRVLTILREDDSEEQVGIDPSLSKPAGETQTPEGQTRKLYNPKLGEYDVAVTVGPSFATKRAEAADSMLQFMKAVPQAGPMIGDLIAKNMDWPGAEEIATRLAASLPPNLLGKDMSNFPPEAKAMLSALQMQLQQLTQEHQRAIAIIGDKEADREIEREKIARDLEGKITVALVNAESKMVSIMDTEMKRIGDMVGSIQQQFELQSAVQAERDKAEKARDA